MFMAKAKRIFFVTDIKDFANNHLHYAHRKLIKGLIRLGHDAQVFSYRRAFLQAGPIMSRKFARRLCKSYVADKLLVKQIKNYNPDIVHVHFANYLDAKTVMLMRDAAPNAFFIGRDGDLWPELHRNRIRAAGELDLVVTAYEGEGLQPYKDAGIRCMFIPNYCDPDIDHRYEVAQKWKTDILFTGQTRYKHKRYPTEDLRYQLLSRLAGMRNCTIYGCLGRPRVEGMDYLYAISGARIGLSVNAANDVRLCHSNRFIHYLAGGTFVLTKRVPDSDLLFKDCVHLRYFDTVEEFFDLANWYLNHEDERIKIANAGMQRAHTEFNCEKMAKYMLELIETGTYDAPWTEI
jgi:glycosyltransferase involved in cell wall biosynthesis